MSFNSKLPDPSRWGKLTKQTSTDFSRGLLVWNMVWNMIFMHKNNLEILLTNQILLKEQWFIVENKFHSLLLQTESMIFL